MNRTLLVIDMLNDFTTEGAPLFVPEARRILPAVRREVEQAHRRGDHVVFVCDAHAPDDPEFDRWPRHAVFGTPGAEVNPAVAPADGDAVVQKTTLDAFYHTRLDKLLAQWDTDAVRLTGCITHICVLMAAMEASVRGYAVEVAEDAVADLDPADQAAALKWMKTVAGARVC